MMTIETARLQISLSLQQQCTSAAVNDLAAAQVKIAELESKVAELTRGDVVPPPSKE